MAGNIAAVDGSAAALGTQDAVPHLDHVHPLGPLVANLDFNEYEAVDFVVYKTNDYASLVETEAKLIYYPTDDHLYCYVA